MFELPHTTLQLKNNIHFANVRFFGYLRQPLCLFGPVSSQIQMDSQELFLEQNLVDASKNDLTGKYGHWRYDELCDCHWAPKVQCKVQSASLSYYSHTQLKMI